MSLSDKLKNWKKLCSIENFFLIIAVLFGLAMAVIGTPFQECDGWTHFIRAMDVSYGNVLAPITPLNHESGYTVIPDNYEELSYRITTPASGEGGEYKQYLKSIKPAKKTKLLEFHEGTMSVFYYPQAIGLCLGRWFGLSVFGWVLLGKLTNFVVFLLLTYYAIKITPVLKNSMTAIALLPMTLYQAASYSPDSMLNGLCFLFVALCLYYAYGDKEKIGIKDVLLLGTVLAFVFLCKYVYIFLGLLVFIIPKEKFGSNKEYFKKFMIALIPLLILGIVAVSTMVGVVSAGSQAAVEGTVEGAAEGAASGLSPLGFLLQNPLNIIKVLVNTFMVQFNTYMTWLDVLGTLNYGLGPLVFIVPMFLMYVIGSDVSEFTKRIKLKDKIIALVAFGMVCAGIILGIYIGDTAINHAGEYIVVGVQGRYFIACLPALAFVLTPRKRTNEDKYFSYKILAGEFVVLLIAVRYLWLNCY